MLAALIGSWVDRDDLGGPDWMLERAAEYMYANEAEQVIRIGRTIMTPANLVEQFQMQHTLFDITAFPRHLLGEKEAALHGLAGGLDTVIEVYDATANEIVTYGATTSPTRARWIVRYPNGTYGASLCRGLDDQLPGPGPAEDRPREPPPSEPDRPDEAQGAGYYTSYTEATNITTAMQGPNYAGDQAQSNLGLGLVTFNVAGLDFHGLNKILCWLQLGQAGGGVRGRRPL